MSGCTKAGRDALRGHEKQDLTMLIQEVVEVPLALDLGAEVHGADRQ